MGANAQTSVPSFADGQVLTGQQQTEINTGIPVFATSVERDAAFGGTGEKVLAEGQFAFLEDTNATQFYDGSTWQPVGVAPGLILVTSQTIGSAVAFVDITSAFSATYENYLVTVTGGVVSTAAYLRIILGATTANYYSSLLKVSFAAGAVTGEGFNNGDKWPVVGYGNTNNINFCMSIQSPQLAKNTYYSSTYTNPAGGIGGTSAGYLDNSTQYTGFTLSPASGTLTGGTIRVYGYANS